MTTDFVVQSSSGLAHCGKETAVTALKLNRLLAQMALELADLDNHEDTIEAVAQYARIAVNTDDAGVLLVHANNQVETAAGTSKDVDKAHQLQAEYGEGPCLAAIAGGDEIYVVSNTLDDQRWPTWGKAAADLGYFSVVSASLQTDAHRIGSLNAYSRNVDAFDDSDAEVIQLLSGHASAALAASKTLGELHNALSSRSAIGQAQGILMHAFDIDAQRAFAFLRRLSQDRNVKLVRIAQEIIDSRGDIAASAEHSRVER